MLQLFSIAPVGRQTALKFLVRGGSGLAEAMRITQQGRVGIGIANPEYVLHSASYDNTGVAATLLWGQYYGGAVGVSSTSPSYYAFHVMANIDSAGAGHTEGAKSLFYVRADGNVGIGTTSPKAKLAVNGEIFAKKIRVTVASADWPDYVFRSGYQLPSLYQVEKYIRSNQHLPGIPSATEVEKEGLDVGEMDRKLLQKLEELTLYLIEQQKKLDAQEEQIKVLQQQNDLLTKCIENRILK